MLLKDLPDKFKSIGKLIGWALLIPKVKRAFSKATKECDSQNLQFDDIDHYHVRNAKGYNFFGMTLEERDKRWPREKHSVGIYNYDNMSDDNLEEIFIRYARASDNWPATAQVQVMIYY